MRRFVSLVTIGALILFLAACGSQGDDSDNVAFDNVVLYDGLWKPENKPMSCLFQALSIAEPTLVTDGSLLVPVRDQIEWQDLWEQVLLAGRENSRECMEEDDVPSFGVNFEDQMLIVLVESDSTSGYLLEADRAVLVSDQLILEVERTTPCCGVRNEITYPYHILSTRRFDGDIDFTVSEIVSPTPGPRQ